VTLIAPDDTNVSAGWVDQGKAEGSLTTRFTVDKITSYTSGWKGIGKLLGHVREVDQATVDGPISVREGQEIVIDVIRFRD